MGGSFYTFYVFFLYLDLLLIGDLVASSAVSSIFFPENMLFSITELLSF
jgi:hypothetical protein